MGREAPRILLCLFVAGLSAALMVDPRNNLFETAAMGFGMLSMLILALVLAQASRRQEDSAGD